MIFPALVMPVSILAMVSASPCATFSIRIVDLLRTPRGRPAGFPLLPFSNLIVSSLLFQAGINSVPRRPAATRKKPGAELRPGEHNFGR
jgi:hypothetical protein